MPFADENQKHVLIVTVYGPPSKPEKHQYKLSGFMRVYDPANTDGTYLQPLPADVDQLIGIKFDKVEFVQPVANKNTGGDYDLTHYHADMKIGRRNA